MMTTYELMRRLMQVDPTGQRPVMVTVTTENDGRTIQVDGFIDEVWVEYPEEADTPFIVLSGVDN